MALFMHSFSWSLMIMLPIAFTMNFNITLEFLLMFLWNMIMHASTDDAKANQRKINLIQDQLTHLTQIIITAIVLL